jgi:hypothetical protein
VAPPAPPAIPRLPLRSPRVASYLIHVELDPARHTLTAHETVTWQNPTFDPVPDLWFHLYLNAFKGPGTTFMRERERDGQPLCRAGEWGHIDVTRLVAAGADLTARLAFERPDDGNADDETVVRVPLPAPVGPRGTITVEIDFTATQPRVIARTGHVGPDFHLVAQWFPKLGVYEPRAAAGGGGWRCHQQHALSEFFADYGRYEVWITVPLDVTVAATGWCGRPTRLSGDRMAYRYEQEDVHDFAFVAQRGLYDLRRAFVADLHRDPALEERLRRLGVPEADIRLTDVDVRLIVGPEHVSQADRFFAAAFAALRDMGYRYGRYPYTNLTIVDPPPLAASAAGMEYPTFVTSQTAYLPRGADEGPENVTLHELAHQHFYGLLGSNEVEEPWLDEGFASYAAARTFAGAYGDVPRLTAFGGLPLAVRPLAERRRSLPLDALVRDVPHATFVGGAGVDPRFALLDDYRREPPQDEMRRRAWGYTDTRSYNFNAYVKPLLLLSTIEGLLGEERMLRLLRGYAARHRFGHPTSADFRAALAAEGEPAAVALWDDALAGAATLDYAVASLASAPAAGGFDSEVLVRRVGGLVAPVVVEVEFADGVRIRERWDGRDGERRLRYRRAAPAVAARVDPDGKLALEWDVSNNARATRRDHRPAARFGAKVVLWLQSVLAFAGGGA